MLDRITDLSTSEVHDAVRAHLVAKHAEDSLVVLVFDTTVENLLDEGDYNTLEGFLQSQWDAHD